ncbi:MAG: trypsin-like peptidase domain-containing protein [Oligoflexus sp.]|nr:trypsin-like peptidase domain-containing protein [Oligoflexus sp.]
MHEIVEPASLKVAGIPRIEIDQGDAFEMTLETTDSIVRDYMFKIECPEKPCPERLKLSKNGSLSLSADDQVETKGNFSILIKTGLASLPENKWTSNYLRIYQSSFGYRSGDKWERTYSNQSNWSKVKPMSQMVLAQRLKSDEGSSSSEQKIQAGTSLFLGKFKNEYLVLTADHVFNSSLYNGKATCDGRRAYAFDDDGSSAVCKRILWRSESFDAVLLAVSPTESKTQFDALPICIQTGQDPAVGDRLAIVGYGSYRNLAGYLGVSSDADCKVVTPDRYPTKDLPSHSPIGYFLFPCDVSDGDSGGAVINRTQRRIMGLVLGGNKSVAKTPSSDELRQFTQDNRQDAEIVSNAVSILLKDLFSEIRRSERSNVELVEMIDEVVEKNSKMDCTLLPNP